MVTVPAHSFCAPTRAKLMAALRSMPGVCAVLASSWLPGITRTPSCFHAGASLPSSWGWGGCACVLMGTSLAPRAPPVTGVVFLCGGSIERGVHQVAEQVAKEDALPWGLREQHAEHVLLRVHEERGAPDPAPEVLARRPWLRGLAARPPHRKAQAEPVAGQQQVAADGDGPQVVRRHPFDRGA